MHVISCFVNMMQTVRHGHTVNSIFQHTQSKNYCPEVLVNELQTPNNINWKFLMISAENASVQQLLECNAFF